MQSYPAIGDSFSVPTHSGPETFRRESDGETFFYTFRRFQLPSSTSVTVTVEEIPEWDKRRYLAEEVESMPMAPNAPHIWLNDLWGPLAWCIDAEGCGQWLPVAMLTEAAG